MISIIIIVIIIIFILIIIVFIIIIISFDLTDYHRPAGGPADLQI